MASPPRKRLEIELPVHIASDDIDGCIRIADANDAIVCRMLRGDNYIAEQVVVALNTRLA